MVAMQQRDFWKFCIGILDLLLFSSNNYILTKCTKSHDEVTGGDRDWVICRICFNRKRRKSVGIVR